MKQYKSLKKNQKNHTQKNSNPEPQERTYISSFGWSSRLYFLLVLWLHKGIIADWIWNREWNKFNSYILSFHFLHNTEVFFFQLSLHMVIEVLLLFFCQADKFLVQPHFHTFAHVPTCRLWILAYPFPWNSCC